MRTIGQMLYVYKKTVACVIIKDVLDKEMKKGLILHREEAIMLTNVGGQSLYLDRGLLGLTPGEISTINEEVKQDIKNGNFYCYDKEHQFSEETKQAIIDYLNDQGLI